MDKVCKSCGGECCKTISIPVVISPEVDLAWLTARGALCEGGNWMIISECRHLSRSGRCKIYATRPQSCRDYPVGGVDCKATQAHKKAGRK